MHTGDRAGSLESILLTDKWRVTTERAQKGNNLLEYWKLKIEITRYVQTEQRRVKYWWNYLQPMNFCGTDSPKWATIYRELAYHTNKTDYANKTTQTTQKGTKLQGELKWNSKINE